MPLPRGSPPSRDNECIRLGSASLDLSLPGAWTPVPVAFALPGDSLGVQACPSLDSGSFCSNGPVAMLEGRRPGRRRATAASQTCAWLFVVQMSRRLLFSSMPLAPDTSAPTITISALIRPGALSGSVSAGGKGVAGSVSDAVRDGCSGSGGLHIPVVRDLHCGRGQQPQIACHSAACIAYASLLQVMGLMAPWQDNRCIAYARSRFC